MNSLDVIGTFLSLLGTYYFVKANVKMWLIYILAAMVNITLYYQSQMYATLSLEWIYLGLSIYGWVYWSKGPSTKSRPITILHNRERTRLILVNILLISIIYFILTKYSSTSMSVLEAAAVGTSLIAQWLSSRKLIDCWFVWIIADTLFLILMIVESLPFHAFLFSVYLLMAILGWLNWKRLINIQLQYENLGEVL